MRIGPPGPSSLTLPLAETAPLLITGADRSAHHTLRRLLDGWARSLAETGPVDVLGWSELDVFLDSIGHPGVNITPSLGAWLAALRQARTEGVPRPTVFMGYEITGTAGDELLATSAGQELEGPGWHLLWAATPDSAGGRLATELPWRSRMAVEPDARHVELSRPGRPPERVLAVWDMN